MNEQRPVQVRLVGTEPQVLAVLDVMRTVFDLREAGPFQQGASGRGALWVDVHDSISYPDAKQRLPKGMCNGCGQVRALRGDGLVRYHAVMDWDGGRGRHECEGSRKSPSGSLGVVCGE